MALQQSVNDAIDSIIVQTGNQDRLLIEKLYYECKQDVVSTVLILLDKVDVTPKPARNIFDDMRDILDAKAVVFQNMMEANRKANTST
jgi:hypothetical protein